MESCRQLIINLLWIFCNIAVLCPSIYGAEGVNATELLDRFDRGSGSQGNYGEGCKSGGTSLRLEASNESNGG